MKLYGINAIPPKARVTKVFDTKFYTGLVNLGWCRGHSIDKQSQEVRRKFAEMVADEANAIVGVQVSTSAVPYYIGVSVEVNFRFAASR